MKIINSSVKIIEPTGYSLKDIMNSIELAARVSHASIGTRYFRVKDEDFAKKLEEVASDSAGKQMLEFAIAMYEKNNSGN